MAARPIWYDLRVIFPSIVKKEVAVSVGDDWWEGDLDSAVSAVAAVRDSVCALMKITKTTKTVRKGKTRSKEIAFGLGFVGTAWCVTKDRFLVTAHHTLNDGKPRDPQDRFYVFTVPGNGDSAYQFPVVDFPFENQANDLAILEIGPPAAANQHITAVPVTLTPPPDGTIVLTYGFPSPSIQGANLDQDGNFLGGGQFCLKGHANEGIIAAQYELSGARHYEFNVGWHHGESGGPVFVSESGTALAVMQHYRNIKSPHGVVAGPHVGRGLDVIRDQLEACGATLLGLD